MPAGHKEARTRDRAQHGSDTRCPPSSSTASLPWPAASRAGEKAANGQAASTDSPHIRRAGPAKKKAHYVVTVVKRNKRHLTGACPVHEFANSSLPFLVVKPKGNLRRYFRQHPEHRR